LKTQKKTASQEKSVTATSKPSPQRLREGNSVRNHEKLDGRKGKRRKKKKRSKIIKA
jgi:hypothetical protein